VFNNVTRQKRFVGVWLSPAGYDTIRAMARRETNNNVSEMVRTLLREATNARMRKADLT
jgi:hypothetical protein